jgi:DNA-binding MarR family transcriptional regulator
MPTYRAEIHHLFQAIDAMRTKSDDMPAQQLLCLLAIARHPGITAEQLGREVGVNQSSVSRNTMALSEWHRVGKPGAGYIERVEDPVERRRFIFFLTPKGKSVIKKALEAVSGSSLTDFDSPTAKQAWSVAARQH